MKKLLTLSMIFCLLLTLVGCSRSKSSTSSPTGTTQNKAKVSLALLRLTSSAPLFIAMEKGYFAKENLAVTPQWFDAAQPIAIATASDKVDVGATGITASLYNMAASGQKLAIVADKGREEKGFPSSALLVTKTLYDSGINSVADIKGKRIGITQKGSTFHYMLGRILETKGLTLKDVTIVPLGKLSAVMAALQSGQIDGCILNEPNITKVTTAGYGKTIVQIGDLIPYQTSGIFFSPSFTQKQDVAVRFMRAYVKACNYYYDNAIKDASPAKKAEIVKIIAKYTKAPESDITLGLPYIDRSGKLLASDIKTQIAWYRAHNMLQGDLQADQIINTTFLEKALKK
ncbi:MAG: ABC transporter substrate-binding protein [Acidaminococcaceae bacterium]|nr:ABC transporter substrate-binding protein [Acidaminococcaceae bacterium]MDD4722327.1 ABC transporter substrate-binding protein [Acidaminococcaceae bacterium]